MADTKMLEQLRSVPLFQGLSRAANPDFWTVKQDAPIVASSDKKAKRG